ncbi:MAG: hypothetical protein QGH20_00935 [Candidatus Latescibacteria bacterium]|jgi:mannose-6-phosphate isomerase-like protein (cupin superfamily)|nr:hypothetical protein [Candidatus Latescibacterota bacterium]
MPDIADQLADPGTCVVRLGTDERVSEQLSQALRPVDISTFHVLRLPANSDVELHFHDFDEYWLFIEGTPTITLRTPSGVTEKFDLGPGDMIACVRGIEHTLAADHELIYYQYSSTRHEGDRSGHLTR